MQYELLKTPLNYYEVYPKPSSKSLSEYYEKKYWQGANKTAASKYSDLEISYFKHKAKLNSYAYKKLSKGGKNADLSILDVGCGEGWDLSAATQHFKKIRGLDYSSHGVATHNPEILGNLVVGDIYESLDKEIKSGEQYDFIILKNVIEHVLNPVELVESLKALCSKTGIICIQAPNDFSIIQKYLLEKNLVSKEYWVTIPDHLNYFSKDSLDYFYTYLNFEILMTIADFPIEIDLLSSDSNYVSKPHIGKSSHTKRLRFEEIIKQSTTDSILSYYKALANLGLGRCLTYFLSPKTSE